MSSVAPNSSPQYPDLIGITDREGLEHSHSSGSAQDTKTFSGQLETIKSLVPRVISGMTDHPLETLGHVYDHPYSLTGSRPEPVLAPPPSFGRPGLAVDHNEQSSGAVDLSHDPAIEAHPAATVMKGVHSHRGNPGTIAQEMAGLFSSARGRHVRTSPPRSRTRSTVEQFQADLRYPDEWTARYTKGV